MVSKSLIFLVKSFMGNLYRHLAIFTWSHWLYYPQSRQKLFKRKIDPTEYNKYRMNEKLDLNVGISLVKYKIVEAFYIIEGVFLK